MGQVASEGAAASAETGSSLVHRLDAGGGWAFSEPVLRRTGIQMVGSMRGAATRRQYSTIDQIPSSIRTEDPTEMRNG